MEALSELHDARWIGVSQEELNKKTGNILAYFRTSFRLRKLEKMQIAVSANSRYKLWLNGHRVLVGPCKGDKWRHYYETTDIGKYLVTGENIIAVEVIYYPPSNYREKNTGGPMSVVSNVKGPWLILKGCCKTEDGRVIADVTTGKAPWMVMLDEAVSWIVKEPKAFMPVGANEKVNGDRQPWGWKNECNMEDCWMPAFEKWPADGSLWGEFSPLPLEKRPIPLMFEKKRAFLKEMKIRSEDLEPFSFSFDGKAILEPGTKKVIELDACELTTGYFTIKTFGGTGSRISIQYAESYTLPPVIQYPVKGMRDDCANFKLEGYEDIYLPSGNYDTYEPFWFRTFRFVRLEVEVGEEQLIIFKPYYNETGYPLEVISHIESDEKWIKQLWDVSIRTLQRCMHETYEDCPYYEQIQYTLDTRLEALFTYMVSGDTRLALKALEDFHCSMTPEGIMQSRAPSDEPNIIPVFSLYWIFMLEDYYRQTGDESIIKRYRHSMDRILDWFDRKIGSYGLAEKFLYWEFIDWVGDWQDSNGYINGIHPASNKGPTATNNLIYAAALKSASNLSLITGRTQLAGEYLQRSEAILKNVEKYCWNENAGMYQEGPEVDEFTQHAQAWAVLSGLVEEERAVVILKKALDNENVACCTFVFSFFLFRALEMTGMYEYTNELWDKWKEALHMNLTTWPEDLTGQRSDCHGWGSLPLYEFTRCILGVQPEEPGWRKIKIQPHCLTLPNARGRVITNAGIIEVEWENTSDGFIIKGCVPLHIYCRLVLPDGSTFEYPEGGPFYAKV